MIKRMAGRFAGAAALLAVAVSATTALAGTLAVDQTQGYGANKLLTFTYTQQFACVVQPFDDRTYKGLFAAVYPAQLSHPQCQIGAPSKIDPTGLDVAKTDKLYVIVPFFETNKSTPAFTPALGAELKKLFGMVPDAFKPQPGVAVQCPEPGSPTTRLKGKPGTCTMHPTDLDLGPVLTSLGKIPAKTVVDLPLVNHSHILPDSTIQQAAEWWQVVVVLITDPKVWPNASGTTGITSLAKLRAAQSHKEASADVSSNFFLFFSSQDMASMNMAGH
jgi:hypothetical protein